MEKQLAKYVTTTAPTGKIAPFGLRMLPELHQQIELAARNNGRSQNSEIISRLNASFAAEARSYSALSDGDLKQMAEMVAQRLFELQSHK